MSSPDHYLRSLFVFVNDLDKFLLIKGEDAEKGTVEIRRAYYDMYSQF